MKYKTALISLLILLLFSAFAQNPKPAGSSLLRPLLALPLPEGRTLDEGHDSGFIDWSGSVGYINLNHKDGICPTGCWEWVTRISNGSSVSGSFAPVDVAYFEVMVAFTHNSAAGTAVLNACGSSAAWYLYVGPGSGLPGFVSMSVPVPSGCASWSLSASGGYVDFRSVDANYVSPPPPVATNTVTPLPTATFSPTGTMTPSPTATQTPAPTDMFTPTLTATETPTATETLAPGVTPSDTPSPTLTSTPSATLPPGVTPSDTPVPTDTPIPPAPTNTPVQPPSSGSGQGGSGGFVLPTATATPTTLQPTFTHTPVTAFGIVSATPNLVETARVMIFGTSTPTPTPKPAGSSLSRPASGAGKSGSSFPWWLLAAGGAAAYATSKRKQIAQRVGRYWEKIRASQQSVAAAMRPSLVRPAKANRRDRFVAGVNVVQDINASVAEEKVIEPELRRLQVLSSWNQADYWRRFPDGMTKDLTLIEGIGPKVQRVLNDNGYHTMADLATADPAKLRGLLQEQKWHFMNPDSWVHQARLAAIDDQKGLQALQSELKGGRGPLPQGTEENLMQRLVELEEIAESSRLPNRVLDGVDSVSDGLSIFGNLGYAITGDARWKAAGDTGDVLGIFGGIMQIVKCSRVAGQSLQNLNFANIGRGVTVLGRVTGVLSIVTGVFGLVSGIRKISNSLADGKRDTETLVGALDALAGFSATVGGVMLLIPGLQPIAGIALGVSAVLSGASVVAENWGWIRSQLQNTAQVWRDNFRQAGQIVQKVNRIIREGAAKTVERGGQALAQGVERAGERLAGEVNRAAEKAAQEVERGAQAAGRIVQAVSQTISRGIETVGHAAAQGMRQVTQAAAQAVNNAGQALARGSERAANAVASWARPFSPALANGIERAGQSVARVVTNVTQRVSSTITQAGQRVSGAIQRGTQAVASAVRQVGQSVASRIVRGGQSVANAVQQVGQKVSGGVRAAAQGVSSTVKSWTSSIGRWLRRP